MGISSYYIFAYATLLVITFQVYCLDITTDQSALLSLKAHLTNLDPHHILTENWTDSSSVCNWIGVTCNLHHHRVTSLNMSNMALSGTISPKLGNLSFLISLDLRNNFFSGILPRELFHLRRLKFISLKNNNFEGEIPSWFGHLPKLEVLSLARNTFTGNIPKSLSNLSNLNFLSLSSNQLSGVIPPEIGDLQNLVEFAIEFTQISGPIPSTIGKLKSLQFLYLGQNQLNGVIPVEIGNLHNLVEVALQRNQISGALPTSIFNLTSLQTLSIWQNKLSGKLSRDIGNLTMLQELSLSDNNFTGVLPTEIGHLHQLRILSLYSNAFTGSIAPEIFNISTLVVVSLSLNGLSGSLPTHLCIGSPILNTIALGGNNISGKIPDSISNCAHLTNLGLGENKFTGFVPRFLGNLSHLVYLSLSTNNLRFESSSSSKFSFFTSLTKCTSLRGLSLGDMPLGGVLPSSIGNLSSSLEIFSAPSCNFNGKIPDHIGNLSNLMILYLNNNEFSAIIPPTFKHLHNLQGLDLNNNSLEGFIPEGMCDLHNLVLLNLGGNRLSGSIPSCLGNVSSLRDLLLFSNKLTSTIPSSLWNLKDLLSLDLSSNSLNGFLPPEMGNLVAANYINLSLNNFSEYIPNTIGNLNNLVNLSLAHNRLEGSVPVPVGSMVGLVTLDLSYNNLSGSIPKSMEELRYLHYFNVSFNNLNGEIPSGGPFRNFTMESFKGNVALCGALRLHGVPLCRTLTRHKSTRKKVQAPLFILAVVVTLVTIVTLTFIFVRCKRKDKALNRVEELEVVVPQRISYCEILQATQQFNEHNLLGVGSYGSVYRGILRDGKVVAVKVFNMQSEAVFKSFDVECEVLRNIRHRNLTKVLRSCSNPDFKALVLEYMPNTNLEKWLYSHNHFLDARQRLDIMIDVAFALEYLHHGYTTPIVHCDLKPSNVLLDEEMIAHVCDFGISKLLGDEESIVLTGTLATLGYIAPEYGLEGIVSTRCDVYSYGVMLMETFTRKRPSDMFGGDLSLKSWVESLLPQTPDRVIDANLFIDLGDERGDKIIECVSSILVLALKCSAESPQDRINIKEALAELQRIKRLFFQ